MHSDWLKLITWLATSNQSALFQRRVTTQLWNKALWLVKTNHMTGNIQSECFISEKSIYSTLKKALWFVKTNHMTGNIQWECFISECSIYSTLKFLHAIASRTVHNITQWIDSNSSCYRWRTVCWGPVVDVIKPFLGEIWKF